MQFSINFVRLTPSCCCVPFAMSREHYDARQADRKTFWCPNCGSPRCFRKGETTQQRELREAKENLERTRQALSVANQGKREARRMYNRIRQRVQAGLCPCCEKTFESLRAHMEQEHSLLEGGLLKALRKAYGLTQANLEDETGVNAGYISAYENGRPVPGWADERLAYWIGEIA